MSDFLLLHVLNRNPKSDWKPGDTCYYWSLGQLHTAVFCRWTVGDHLWAAVFDVQPRSQAIDKDGYDYATIRVTWDELFADREELIDLVVKAFRSNIASSDFKVNLVERCDIRGELVELHEYARKKTDSLGEWDAFADRLEALIHKLDEET